MVALSLPPVAKCLKGRAGWARSSQVRGARSPSVRLLRRWSRVPGSGTPWRAMFGRPTVQEATPYRPEIGLTPKLKPGRTGV